MISLPPCQAVIATMQSAFSDWRPIGHLKNLGVEVYVFKIEDKGDGATYARIMMTPSTGDIEWATATGWKLEKAATCNREGTTVYSLVLVTKRKEKA